MALWFWDGYRLYATALLIGSVFSITFTLVETLRNLHNVRRMAKYSCEINVMRGADENNLIEMNSSDLVPGDVIEVPENRIMPCDAILLTGSAIVNESMLTGESVPVIKTALP